MFIEIIIILNSLFCYTGIMGETETRERRSAAIDSGTSYLQR